MQSSKTLYLVLVIVSVAIVSAQVGAYYYLEGPNNGISSSTSIPCKYFSANSTGAGTISVNTVINYGNGTITWYNQTSVPSNWNAYALTMYVTRCNIQTTYYGQPLNEHLVTAISGLSQHGSLSWSIWKFCNAKDGWTYSPLGADLMQLTNDETLAWAYGSFSSTTASVPPLPGAQIVGSCS